MLLLFLHFFQLQILFADFLIWKTRLRPLQSQIGIHTHTHTHTHTHFISPYSAIIVATVIQTVINTTYYSQLSHARTIHFFSDTTCSFPTANAYLVVVFHHPRFPLLPAWVLTFSIWINLRSICFLDSNIFCYHIHSCSLSIKLYAIVPFSHLLSGISEGSTSKQVGACLPC